MKSIIYLVAIFFFSLIYVEAQEIKEVELEENKEILYGFSFDTDLCAESVIFESWNNWVRKYGSKPKLIKRLINRYEAEGFVLDGFYNQLEARLLTFENENTLTVVNVFQLPNGSYLRDNSQGYSLLNQRLLEFKANIQENCIRYELTEANNYLEKLQNKKSDLEKERTRLEKKIVKLKNQRIQLTKKKEKEAAKIAFNQRKLEYEVDPKKIKKLEKRIASSEGAMEKATKNYESKAREIERITQDIKEINSTIEISKEDIDKQQRVSDGIKNRLNQN